MLFCCVVNLTNEDGEIIKQDLVFFDENKDDPIFEIINQPINSQPFVPRHPPLIQGNLSATRVFGCISQKCRLSAKFFEDSQSGPRMTSFLSRDERQLTLAPYDKESEVVQASFTSLFVEFLNKIIQSIRICLEAIFDYISINSVLATLYVSLTKGRFGNCGTLKVGRTKRRK